MNYKSKLLSVFLSAGILLNSTSMAFAGQDDVNTKSGDQHTESNKAVKAEKFHTEKFHTKVNDPKWEYRDGLLVMEGTEFSAEQGKDEEEGKIDYVYYEKIKTLWIYGYGCNMKSYAPYDQGRPIWEKYIDRDDIEHLVIIDVLNIGDFAFYNCKNLTTVDIPNSVTAIGKRVFYLNLNLETVVVPNSVKKIDKAAFGGLPALKSIALPRRFERQIDDILCDSKDNEALRIEYTRVLEGQENNITWTFDEETKTLYIKGKGGDRIEDYDLEKRPIWEEDINRLEIEHLVIDGVMSIGDYAFSGYFGVETLELSEGLCHIGIGAFLGNISLTTVKIPSSVGTIKWNAFFRCGLTSVEFQEGLYSIEAGAFARTNLTTVTIPSSVREIGIGAFAYLPALTSITLPRRFSREIGDILKDSIYNLKHNKGVKIQLID